MDHVIAAVLATRSRERRAHLRQDQAGVPCACDDRTPCLAHAGITGRRRFLRPSNAKDRKP